MTESRTCFWLRDLHTSVCSLLLMSGWPLKNYTKLRDNESFPRDQECAICLITLYDKLARLNNVVLAKHKLLVLLII